MTEETEENKEKGETITIKKDSLWRYSTFVLLAIVIIGAFVILTGRDGNVSPPTGQVIIDNPAPTAAAPTARANVKLSADDNIRGDVNARVQMIEYSDFECPFCARFYTQAVGEIKSTYENEEDFVFGYKHFPLSFHTNAQKAAEASECAATQGKFWEMHDMIFEQGVVGGVATFKGYAKQIGLDTGEFDSCLDSGETASDIQADFLEGQNNGISGTPGFLINGRVISGACPFDTFDKAIQAELAGDDWQVVQCQFVPL